MPKQVGHRKGDRLVSHGWRKTTSRLIGVVECFRVDVPMRSYVAPEGICCSSTCLWKKYVARRPYPPPVPVHNGTSKVLLLGAVGTNQQACVSRRKSQHLEAVKLSNIDT